MPRNFRRLAAVITTAALGAMLTGPVQASGPSPKATVGCNATSGCGSQQVIPGNGDVLNLAVNNKHTQVEVKVAFTGTANSSEDFTVTIQSDGNYVISYSPYGLGSGKCLGAADVLRSSVQLADCIVPAPPSQQWTALSGSTGTIWELDGTSLVMTAHNGTPYSPVTLHWNYWDANQNWVTVT